jgi:hypothetical protein
MVQISAQSHFNNMIIKQIGRKSVPGDFSVEDLTLEYEHYRGHTIEEDQDNAYEEGLPNNNNLNPLPTPETSQRQETTTSLLRYCPPWAMS